MKKLFLAALMLVALAVGSVFSQWSMGGNFSMSVSEDGTDLSAGVSLSYNLGGGWLVTAGSAFLFDTDYSIDHAIRPWALVRRSIPGRLGPFGFSVPLGASYTYYINNDGRIRWGLFTGIDATFAISERWLAHFGVIGFGFNRLS